MTRRLLSNVTNGQSVSRLPEANPADELTATWGIAKIEFGDIAQLGEHCVRIAGVGGSNPPISTIEFWRADRNAFRQIKIPKGLQVSAVKGWVDITIRDLANIAPQ